MRKLVALGILGLWIISCHQGQETELDTLRKKLQTLTKEKETIMETAKRNKNSTLAFFKALENENVEALVNLFSEDAEHINPYASGLFPEGAKGREDIRNYWASVFPNFDGMEFRIEAMYAMEDPNIVFVKYQGRIQLKNGAGYYENDYYSTFKFNAAGKIVEYVEIFNPITAARGFGLLDKIK
ncbi:MAG: nuclear transport factor 2 family protein [Bacteroidota bacterium]